MNRLLALMILLVLFSFSLGSLYYHKEHIKWNKNANHCIVLGTYDFSGAQFLSNRVISNYTKDNDAKINTADSTY